MGRRDKKSWLSASVSWHTWDLYSVKANGRLSDDPPFIVYLPPNPSHNQMFEQLLKGGHIVRRSQRSRYSFQPHDAGGYYVLLNGRPEYLLVRI